MIRHLPEDALTTAAIARKRSGDGTGEPPRELSEEEEDILDAAFWTGDRKLMAVLINTTQTLLARTGHYEEPPQFDIVGPRAWRHKPEEGGESKGSSRSIEDVLSMFMK